ncbi:MAG TPA: DNA methyltransferase [Gemmatimonadaceae bacterium]|nr:DNA methyltransferase [Gemmatimonadaceae bacterium]
MPTLRAAAVLLAAATDIASLGAIATAVGCIGPPGPLDATARTTLGLPDDCQDAWVARGPGTLRALLLDIGGNRPMREVVTNLARRLTTRAPHLLWLAIACRKTTTEVAIAAWSPGQSGPRVSALVVDRTHVVDSDAETLCALSAALESVDLLTHTRWVTILGREAVTRRFYRTLEHLVGALATEARGNAPPAARRDIALLYASRLLFLSFLEAKEWLDGDRSFLARHYDGCLSGRGGFQRRVLVPLFFGTLNTPIRSRAPTARALGRIPFLNGGLFSRSPLERTYATLEFRDEELGLFLAELLGRYRFTAREESADWSEAAVDPEMLGRAFESMMASHERRNTGAFFTPHELVARVTDEALTHAVGQSPDDLVAAAARPHAGVRWRELETIRERLDRLRLLDPACGSGAFLVHALEQVARLLEVLGDARPVAERRRSVLTRSIFGVDLNPTAVWLCQLRLWLSVVIDSPARDPGQVPPLPNLDRNIRIGDALAIDGMVHSRIAGVASIARLRARYARAVGARKKTLARALDLAERTAAIGLLDRRIAAIDGARRDIVVAARGRDLFGERSSVSSAARTALSELRDERRAARARRRALVAGAALPFSFATHFADVAGAGGFDVIVGNPPWVRVHRIPRDARSALRRGFLTYRGAAWRTGAAASRAGVGFAAQVDLAALFIERSLALATPTGIVALLVPAKLWRSLAGGGVRNLLLGDHELLSLEDWSNAPALFDAAVYPSLVVARRGKRSPPESLPDMKVTVHAQRIAATWGMHASELSLDASPGAPWLLLPPVARRAFDALRAVGTPLAASRFGPPLLGVKCGCNRAFIVRQRGEGYLADTGNRVELEPELLRPLIRGEHVTRWRIEGNGDRLIWTHGPGGRPLDRLPPRAERWLRGWRRRLVARSDARHAARWWTLFRTEAATPDDARVVWADFGRAPTAALLEPGDCAVPLNTCYVVRCADRGDAIALVTLLNSPLAAAWLAALAEPARGGYRRFLGWTVSLLPLPSPWNRARQHLIAVGERALLGRPPSDADLLEATVLAYGLRLSAVNALLDWNIR